MAKKDKIEESEAGDNSPAEEKPIEKPKKKLSGGVNLKLFISNNRPVMVHRSKYLDVGFLAYCCCKKISGEFRSNAEWLAEFDRYCGVK